MPLANAGRPRETATERRTGGARSTEGPQLPTRLYRDRSDGDKMQARGGRCGRRIGVRRGAWATPRIGARGWPRGGSVMNQRGQSRPGVGVVAGSLAYELAKKWWILLVRGVLLILIGVLAFVSPLTWVVFVGVYA